VTTIGCADDYEVVLEDSSTIGTVAVQRRLSDLEFSELTWGRVESAVSEASVTLALDAYGPGCCPYPLRGWDQSIAIYRNGRRQWGGPIVGWRVLDDGRVQIAARDLLAFAMKEFIYTNRTFAAVNWQEVISQLVTDISGGLGTTVPWSTIDPASFPEYAEYAAGFPYVVDRTYAISQMKYLLEAMTELAAEAGETFSCGPERVHYGAYGLAQENGLGFVDTARPIINNHTVFGIPKVVVDCLGVATDVFAVGSAAGPGGFQRVNNVRITPLPDGLTNYSEHFHLQAAVQPDPRWNLEAQMLGGHVSAVAALAPVVTLEAVHLTPEFGSMPEVSGSGPFRPGLDGLAGVRPGLVAKWGFDDDCWTHLPVTRPTDPRMGAPALEFTPNIELVRLVQLDVRVAATDDGFDESIQAHFTPWAELSS